MVTLTFTVDEVNYMLAALGARPFSEVQSLIFKIKTDAESQLAPKVDAVESTTEA